MVQEQAAAAAAAAKTVSVGVAGLLRLRHLCSEQQQSHQQVLQGGACVGTSSSSRNHVGWCRCAEKCSGVATPFSSSRLHVTPVQDPPAEAEAEAAAE
jgi:hypothetical protein